MGSITWARSFSTETSGLILEPCNARQADELARIVSDARVYRPFYVGMPPRQLGHANPEQWIQQPDDWGQRHVFHMVASLYTDQAVVGCVKLMSSRLAYFVAPQFWRQGFGLEMVNAFCEHLPSRLGVPMLETLVIRENLGSRLILERSHFDFWG